MNTLQKGHRVRLSQRGVAESLFLGVGPIAKPIRATVLMTCTIEGQDFLHLQIDGQHFPAYFETRLWEPAPEAET